MFLCLRRPDMSPFTSTVRRDLMSVILNMLFTNMSLDFLTSIDWLLQSHGSIGCFDWFKNSTFEHFVGLALNVEIQSISRFPWKVEKFHEKWL